MSRCDSAIMFGLPNCTRRETKRTFQKISEAMGRRLSRFGAQVPILRIDHCIRDNSEAVMPDAKAVIEARQPAAVSNERVSIK